MKGQPSPIQRFKWRIFEFVTFKCAYWDRGWRARFLPAWDAIMDRLEKWGWESPAAQACDKVVGAIYDSSK